MDITGLGFANGLSLNQADRQPLSPNIYLYNYGWQQILTIQYIQVSIKRGSMIVGLVSWVIRPPLGCRQS